MTTGKAANPGTKRLRPLWLILGFALTIGIVVLFSRPIRCALEYRENADVYATAIGIVAPAALAIIALLLSDRVRNAVWNFCGGVTVGLFFFLVAVLLLPPIPRIECTIEPDASTPVAASTSSSIPLPDGYVLYDDFSVSDALETNWWIIDESGICDLSIREGQLDFACRNETASNALVGLRPRRQASGISGVAVVVSLEVGEHFQLATNWECTTDGSQRAYQLELGLGVVRVQEFYPQDDWQDEVLATVAVEAGQPHLLQMERVDNELEFLIDGQKLSLEKNPNLPACFVIVDWGLGLDVWRDGYRVGGQVDQVSIQE